MAKDSSGVNLPGYDYTPAYDPASDKAKPNQAATGGVTKTLPSKSIGGKYKS